MHHLGAVTQVLMPLSALVVICLQLLPSSTAQSALFVGNSFTFWKDTPGLCRQLLQVGNRNPNVQSVAEPAKAGYTFCSHADDLQDDSEPLNQALYQTTASWDFVVLQDQSQIPGSYKPGVSCDARKAPICTATSSQICLAELADSAAGTGATVLLFETWGYRSGDSSNPQVYGSFPAMQYRVSEGYRRYQRYLVVNSGHSLDRVKIARVGAAFGMIFNDAAAVVPHKDLYDQDSIHPSYYGACLAAYVISAAIAGAPLMGRRYYFSTSPNEARVWAYLQDIAWRATDPSFCTPFGNAGIPAGLVEGSPPACASDTTCGGACRGYCTGGIASVAANLQGQCRACLINAKACTDSRQCCSGRCSNKKCVPSTARAPAKTVAVDQIASSSTSNSTSLGSTDVVTDKIQAEPATGSTTVSNTAASMKVIAYTQDATWTPPAGQPITIVIKGD